MNYSIIYKAENFENGWVYIGATTKTIEERKADHIQKAKKGLAGYFQKAIGTYGPEAFSWEQIDTATSNQELAEKEKLYIERYDSKKNGYNQDCGGGFRKTVYQFTSEGMLIGEWPSLSISAFVVRGKKKSVSNACLGYNKTYKGHYWSYTSSIPVIVKKDTRKKRVLQLDLKGKQIAVFDSASKASRETGISKTCISRCCRGEREHSGGYHWQYD